MQLLFSSILAFVSLFGAVERSQTAFHSTATAIDPMSLNHKITRSEMLKSFGDSLVIYDSMLRFTKGVEEKVMLFGPVKIFQTTALAQATLVKDKVSHVEFYLPYQAHKGAKPQMPCERSGAIRAEVSDLDALRKNLSKYGDPSVTGESFFVYLANPDTPYLSANYHEHTVTLSVTPEKE